MASPTEEQVNKQREEVAELRRKATEAETQAATDVAARTRGVESERLNREKERLETRLRRRGASTESTTRQPPASASQPSTPPSNPPKSGDDKKE